VSEPFWSALLNRRFVEQSYGSPGQQHLTCTIVKFRSCSRTPRAPKRQEHRECQERRESRATRKRGIMPSCFIQSSKYLFFFSILTRGSSSNRRWEKGMLGEGKAVWGMLGEGGAAQTKDIHITRGGRVTPLSVVRCPLSVDQIGISVKSCPLMAES
jgi:hypothetical protein